MEKFTLIFLSSFNNFFFWVYALVIVCRLWIKAYSRCMYIVLYLLPVNRLSPMSTPSGFEQNISRELINSNQIISEHGGPENQWWIFNWFDGDRVTGWEIHWPACEGELADGTQTDAQSPVHAHMFTQLIFHLTRHRLLSGSVVV